MKNTITTTVLFIGIVLFLQFLFNHTPIQEQETIGTIKKEISQPFVSWQNIKITISEEEQESVMHIKAPKIRIFGNYDLEGEINKAITRYIESFKNHFISGVTTAAEDNGETNSLNIDTKILLNTQRLLSLSFVVIEELAGIKDNEPEVTFLVFDLAKGKPLIEGNELFRDDLAWSKAVRIMKTMLLVGHQGDPSCDLSFAPKENGFAASCIGVDWSQEGRHLSITKDIPMSAIQEYIAPEFLHIN